MYIQREIYYIILYFMHIIYIYIYISLSLSLSLYVCVYIYIYIMYTGWRHVDGRPHAGGRGRRGREVLGQAYIYIYI